MKNLSTTCGAWHGECWQMKQWAEVELPPGQFLGSTGVQTLTPEQLGTEDRRFQAWAKKVSFCSVVWMELAATDMSASAFWYVTVSAGSTVCCVPVCPIFLIMMLSCCFILCACPADYCIVSIVAGVLDTTKDLKGIFSSWTASKS